MGIGEDEVEDVGFGYVVMGGCVPHCTVEGENGVVVSGFGVVVFYEG